MKSAALKSKKTEKVVRDKPIPEGKKATVKELIEKMKKFRTILIASSRGLPGGQFHEIKKKLRGQAEMKVAKKSAIFRAIDGIDKGTIKNLKQQIRADIVVLFSEIDPFELSGILTDSQSSRKAKKGDIAPEDIKIDPGPTNLAPGPAISELTAVGLKIAVKEGKLEIMQGAVVAKKGAEITDKVASVLSKLNVSPIKVGFLPLAAYDAKADAMYVGIVIDKPGTLETLRDMIRKSLGFAAKICYPTKETVGYLIAKAASHEKALEKKISSEKSSEEKSENA